MPRAHNFSYLVTLALLFLLPIFFIPGGALNLDVAKSALLVFGLVIIVLLFLYEIWKEGKFDFPRHPFIYTAALLPVIYLLSAFLATPSSLSLLGYNFEVGTFGFMLLGSVMLILMGMVFSDAARALQALAVFFVSISVVALFVLIKVFFGLPAQAGGDVLVLGNFFGNMGNPIGNWTDLAVAFGLFSAIAAFSLGMIPMKRSLRILVTCAFIIGVVLMVIINFSIAFLLTLVASIFLLLYFWKMEKHFLNTSSVLPQTKVNFFLRPTFLPIVLGVISLIFLVNPTISTTQGTLGDVVARTFKIQNTDVRPSFSATLGISKAVLSQGGLLGSGPNTFGRDWLIYKPVNINATPFWAVAFPFGAGFIPTQIASTGMLGSALWLVFFVFFIILGVKVFNNIPESRALRFTLISTFFISLFLWVSSFLYTPSSTLLVLAFVFSGIFVSLLREAGIISSRILSFNDSPQTRFFSLALLVVIALGALFLGWTGYKMTASAYYFNRAVTLSNTSNPSLSEIETDLNKAINYSPLDIYYVALSRIYFAKAQAAFADGKGIPEENNTILKESLGKSIEAAKNAVSTNPAGYQNWVSLGLIYSALVPKPLSVDGSYESASLAYSEANKRNPNNPELLLLLARLELDKGNVDSARSYIMNSISLKEDYADAYLMLAQLEIQVGDTRGAILSAERLALLMPNNPGLYFELGLLKYSEKDYQGAADTFSKAISISPDYANAKFYLGLALSKLGRLDDARRQFEDLAKTNPDSKEVKAALEAIRAGKSPI